MGWLPIALALAGFMFFVILVNYNSIKSHEEAIKQAFFNFCQTAKARHTLLRIVNASQENHLAGGKQESDLNFKSIEEYRACIRQEKISLEESRLFLQVNRPAKPEIRKILKSLQVLNHRQHININILNRKIKEYNMLISSYPTKMVAKASGHKSL